MTDVRLLIQPVLDHAKRVFAEVSDRVGTTVYAKADSGQFCQNVLSSGIGLEASVAKAIMSHRWQSFDGACVSGASSFLNFAQVNLTCSVSADTDVPSDSSQRFAFGFVGTHDEIIARNHLRRWLVVHPEQYMPVVAV